MESDNNLSPSTTAESSEDISSDLVTLSHSIYDEASSELKVETYSLLSSVCKPCDTPYQKICRYGPRDCLFYRLKIDNSGERVIGTNKFNTSYKNKLQLEQIDCTIINCYNSDCPCKKDSSLPDFAHFSCYAQWVHSNKKSNIKHIYINNTNIAHVSNIENESLKEEIVSKENVILPYCKTRCFKSIMLDINKNEFGTSNKSKKKKAAPKTLFWFNDGGPDKRCSERVVVDWLVTEENSKLYFGGKNKKGKTTSNRKDTYHAQITELIKKENGMLIFF